MLVHCAGQVLTGWRIYPLQLEDLSPINYSNASTRLAPSAAALGRAKLISSLKASAPRLLPPSAPSFTGDSC